METITIEISADDKATLDRWASVFGKENYTELIKSQMEMQLSDAKIWEILNPV